MLSLFKIFQKLKNWLKKLSFFSKLPINKKMTMIIIENFLIILLLFIVADFCLFMFLSYKEMKFCELVDSPELKTEYYQKNYSPYLISFDSFYNSLETNDGFRPVEGLQYNSKPIVLFGCSYAYGHMLENDEILSHKLSQFMKRPILNRAFPSWSVQHMIYQLEKKDFVKTMPMNKKEPEFIIYILMSDHLRRLQLRVFEPLDNVDYLNYKNKKEDLIKFESKWRWLRGSYLIRSLQCLYVDNKVTLNKNLLKNTELLKQHFLYAHKLIKTQYPAAKFIIIRYQDDKDELDKDFLAFQDKHLWSSLRKDKIYIISTRKLTGKDFYLREYKVPDGHPNKKAWDVLPPL